MNLEEYRRRGKEAVDYIANYLKSIRYRHVYPTVKPGYMKYMLPSSAPEEGENFDEIMADFERIVMPGITHFQSPYMHAYFPALNSPASLLGDMLADAIGCLGFTWASSPACTELEIIVMDWLAKMIGLPDDFLHLSPDSTGGGVIQTTASEATLVCMLAARTEAIRRLRETYGYMEDAELNGFLVAYTSDQAHSSVEKAGLIALVKIRFIESDDELGISADKLQEAIDADKESKLVPFFLCATLGTTGACSFDNLEAVGPICKEENIWLHVDAAYAGTAFVCPEHRKWLKGIEYASSFAFNPSKWMMVHFDCSAMWVKRSEALHQTFNVDPVYLRHHRAGIGVDFMHWQIPLSRRFRALKLWFVIRNFGISGLQKHVRKGVSLAEMFERKVLANDRFEVPAKRHLGMVVFRLKDDNERTEELLKLLNDSGLLHCVPSCIKGKYVIRYTITSTYTEAMDIERDWKLIQEYSLRLQELFVLERSTSLAEVKRESSQFGYSLMLFNASLVPKVINASFAAISPNHEVDNQLLTDLEKYVAGTRSTSSLSFPARNTSGVRKQFSLNWQMGMPGFSMKREQSKLKQYDRSIKLCGSCQRKLSATALKINENNDD